MRGASRRLCVRSARHSRLEASLARGEAENRIGEQFELFADRASSATMQANQLRLWFSAMAYVLVDTLRRVGLCLTQFADASARPPSVSSSFGSAPRCVPASRRIHFALAGGCPNKVEFAIAYVYLRRAFGSSCAALGAAPRASMP